MSSEEGLQVDDGLPGGERCGGNLVGDRRTLAAVSVDEAGPPGILKCHVPLVVLLGAM